MTQEQLEGGDLKALAYEHTVEQVPDELVPLTTAVPTSYLPFLLDTIKTYMRGWSSEECLAAVMLRKQVNMTLRAKRNPLWKQVGVGTFADEGYVPARKPFE
jgi:hypothetical protein